MLRNRALAGIASFLSRHACVVIAATAPLVAQTTSFYRTASAQATALPGFGQFVLATYDFNQDGRPDFLVGGEHYGSPAKSAVHVLLSRGDGSFTNATSTYFPAGVPLAHQPIATVADLNRDGLPDFLLYDGGDADAGQQPGGGFLGEEPQLFLSQPNRTWQPSSALRDASLAASSFNSARVHIKEVTPGDIDNDGDIDFWVESGGGFQNLVPHFLINNGDGTFTVDRNYARIPREQVRGPQPQEVFRFGCHALVDLDGDGWLDKVSGIWRRTGNNQDLSRSRIWFNNRAGSYTAAESIELPLPDWNAGFTKTMKVLVTDLDDDGRPDILFAHTREADDAEPDALMRGLYLQVFRNLGGRRFEDVTSSYFLDQSAWTARTYQYGLNGNYPRHIAYLDVNADGRKDLVMEGAYSYLTDNSPAVYLRGASGGFEPINYRAIAGTNLYFGESLYVADLNGDARPDFITIDQQPGADNTYNTPDDFQVHMPILSTAALTPPVVSVAREGAATLRATVTARGPATYQWYRDGAPLAGATQAAYTAPAVDTAAYRVRVGDDVAFAVSAITRLAEPPAGPTARLANLSVRTTVSSGQLMIVGLSVAGGAKPVLLRAIGPGLAAFGLGGTLADPRIDVYAAGSRIDGNDNWPASLAATFSSLGAFPLPAGSRDAALVSQASGSLTAQIPAAGDGLVLVEAYDAGSGYAARLTNLSVRNRVGTGAGVLVAGLTIEGTGTKRLLIRGVGPALSVFGISGFLADPKLELVRVSDGQKLGENDDWQGSLAATFAAVGAFALPAGGKDAALQIDLPPGGYTVQLSGVNDTTGEALIEVYEVP